MGQFPNLKVEIIVVYERSTPISSRFLCRREWIVIIYRFAVCQMCAESLFFLYPITENYTASAPELSIYNKN